MSQTATARPAARTRRHPQAAARRPSLSVVATPASDGSGAFLALCIVLLVGGFVAVLVLNTAMAKGSYTLAGLQRQSDALTDSRDDLRQSLDTVSGPGPLAKSARALGMVPAPNPVFLDLRDGAVRGDIKAATADEKFTVVTETQLTPPRQVRTTPSTPTTASPPPQWSIVSGIQR